MAVLIEAVSIVILLSSIERKYPGGWDAFERAVPNQTLTSDDELVRVGFMVYSDAVHFLDKLQGQGLVFLQDGLAIDIAVADQLKGLHVECSWLEFGRCELDESGKQVVSACRLAGSQADGLAVPHKWSFEESLSNTYCYAPDGDLSKGMKFLRHEDGVDVYLSELTGEEVYVGRTSEI